jgi:hypothetical protein
MEGYETLIQDPYKLNDEVRGRQDEYADLLDHGTPLSCKDPERCRRCYLDKLCGTLDRTIEGLEDRSFETFRVSSSASTAKAPFEMKRAWVKAATLAEAAATASSLPGAELVLECGDYAGLLADVVDGVDAVIVGGKRLVRAEAKTAAQIDQLMSAGGHFEVVVHHTPETAAHVFDHYNPAPPRMAFTVSNYERVTDNWQNDIYLPAFFGSYDAAAAKTENVPACLSGREPRPRGHILDAGNLVADASQGARKIDIFGYARHFIEEHYYTKSRRCRDCVHDLSCEGVHINFVRSHGYAPLMPILDEGAEERPDVAVNAAANR